MFEAFFRYMKTEQPGEIGSLSEFLELTAGKSYLDGLYRFFGCDEISYWNDIVFSCFPSYRDAVTVMSYDWMGRIFAIKKATGHVMLFEPGSGDVYDTEADAVRFHEELIAEYPDECLAAGLFRQWLGSADNAPISASDCVSYNIPLMRGGNDETDNLEVCDMDVYWELLRPFILGR